MKYQLATVVAICVLSSVSNAAPDDAQSNSQSRPKVAVVLGGGGAHGVVHLGVLEELERQRVPIDFVVGTGFGGIIGGLYASGMPVSEIDEFLFDTDWDNVFDPDTGREDLSFRRKRDDADFLVKYSVGVKDGQAKLPTALVPSEKLAQLLQSAVAHTKGVNSFDDLPVPFRTVAMDLVTGGEVVLKSGALDRAMLATVSSPGTLAPVLIDDRPLITGSLINNLPVDVARDMGADIIVVVDIGTYLRRADDLSSIFAIVDQVGHLFQERNSQASLAVLDTGDILIQPDVVAYKETDVSDAAATVAKGAQSVVALSSSFAGIRLDEQQYAAFNAQRVERRSIDPVISRIDLVNDSEVDDAVILAQLRQGVDEPLDGIELEEDLRKIFGIGSFSSVDFNLLEEGDSTVLELTTIENDAGNRFWRFGIAMQDDFNGNSAYTASSSMTWTNLNAMGAEWRNVFRIGEQQQLSTEFYQPLVRSGRYFMSIGAAYLERNVNIFFDGQILGQSRVRETTGVLKVGRIFGNAAQISLGVLGGNGSTHSNIGPNVPSTEFDIGGLVAAWAYDTYNNIYFPKRGTRASLSWVGQRESMGSSFDVDVVAANLGSAKTWGDHTFIGGFTLQSQLEDVQGAQNLVATGGFLQLSGFQADELTGRHTAVGRAIYFRKLRSNPLRGFLDATLYMGGSLEIGNAWQNSNDISLGDSLLAGSLFIGADTFIGPVYFAGGYAQGGNSALYLFVGRPY